MTKKCMSSICLVLLVSGSVALVAGPTADRDTAQSIHKTKKSNEPWNARRVELDDVSLLVTVPPLNEHDNVPLNVVLANRSRKKYLSGQTGYFLDCTIRIKRANGEEVGYSKLGQSLFSGENPIRNQYAFIELPSGSTWSKEYDITDGFTALVPGKYELSLETFASLDTQVEGERGVLLTLVVTDVPFEVQ
ncbi:MAG: hypothetical protein WEB58_01990 [Planctomycetaceae bacterium]